MVRHTGEHLIGEEGVTVATMFPLQSSSVYGSELDAPQADSFVAYCDTAFRWEIFYEWSGTPAMAEVESVVEPNCIRDDIGWGAPGRNRWRL